MKKLVAVLMIMVMVLGMSSMAFAAEKTVDVEILQEVAGEDGIVRVPVEEISVQVGDTFILVSQTKKEGNQLIDWDWLFNEEEFIMIGDPTLQTIKINGDDYYVSKATFEALQAGEFQIGFEIETKNSNHTWTGYESVEVEVTAPPTGPSINLGDSGLVTQGSGKQKQEQQQLLFDEIVITRADGTTATLDDYKVGGFKNTTLERNFSIEFENLVFNFVWVNGEVELVNFVVVE